MKKMKSITTLLFLLATVFLLSAVQPKAAAQETLLQKKDSVVAFVNSLTTGGDSIAVISLGGIYSKGAFTVTGVTDSTQLVPEARYFGSTDWVKISVVNNKTGVNDTLISVADGANPLDFTIYDPCMVGFRLRKISEDRKDVVYVYYRFRREY